MSTPYIYWKDTHPSQPARMTMGDETLLAAMSLPVVIGPVLEEVSGFLGTYQTCR